MGVGGVVGKFGVGVKQRRRVGWGRFGDGGWVGAETGGGGVQ